MWKFECAIHRDWEQSITSFVTKNGKNRIRKFQQICLVNCSHYRKLDNHWLLLVWDFHLPCSWPFTHLTFHRATVKKGVTFRTATPTNSLLWDITLDMGADGAIAVVCQRKAPIPGKRQVGSHHFTLYATVCYLCLFLLSLADLSYIHRPKLLLFEWKSH